MTPDADLLHRYAAQNEGAAFAELVRRYLDLVYGAALRRTGRAHLAEDIVQTVFCDLARQAAALQHHPALIGWLHRSTRNAAIDALRAEDRRQKLARSLTTMPDTASSPVDWERLRPLIDEAMDHLAAADRDLVLLRFFHGCTFGEIGERLRLPESTARLRTGRALEHLRRHLGRRGIVSTGAALGTVLASQSFAAAPAGLASAVTSAALATAPAGAGATLLSLVLMSKLTAPLVSAALAAALTTVVWTSTTQRVSARELAALRQENARLVAASQPGANPDATAAVADEFAAQVAATAHAIDQRLAHRRAVLADQASSGRTAPGATAGPDPSRHRNRGIATPRDASLTFAWAADAGEIGALARMIWFEGNGRTQALAVLDSLPASLRAQFSTPEELYAFFLSAQTQLGPPPGADLLELYEPVELAPGRVALRAPGAKRPATMPFQQTPDGWKVVISEALVPHIARIVLSPDFYSQLKPTP